MAHNGGNMQKALVLMFAGMVLVAGASAQVGKWNGKLSMKMPAATTPEAKKQQDAIMAQMKQFVIRMDLRADKTVVMSTPAVNMGGRTQKASSATGTWKMSGNTLTVTLTKADGKPMTKEQAQPQVLTMSADKKTLTMSPPQAGGGLKIVFTKA
jgi:hypothetical protein